MGLYKEEWLYTSHSLAINFQSLFYEVSFLFFFFCRHLYIFHKPNTYNYSKGNSELKVGSDLLCQSLIKLLITCECVRGFLFSLETSSLDANE